MGRDLDGVTKIGDFGLAVLRHAWVRSQSLAASQPHETSTLCQEMYLSACLSVHHVLKSAGAETFPPRQLVLDFF